MLLFTEKVYLVLQQSLVNFSNYRFIQLTTALLQIEIWVDDVPFKKYLETENPVD